jgi:hypothetical protein
MSLSVFSVLGIFLRLLRLLTCDVFNVILNHALELLEILFPGDIQYQLLCISTLTDSFLDKCDEMTGT